jgi:ArsR family transcriptional regulator
MHTVAVAAEPLDTLLRAFCDRTRLRIMCLLRGGEMCVGDLVDVLQVSQPRASQHLGYLRKAGLVVVRKDGLWSFYSLSRSKHGFHQKMLEFLESCALDVPEIKADRLRADKVRKSGGCCPH